MSSSQHKEFHIRSFVIRGGRGTPGQVRALRKLWPQFGLSTATGKLDLVQTFGRAAPTFLEIGFGGGQTLVAAALAHPDKNFIGVETHKPGIGALLMGVEEHGLTNLRVFMGDVVDVLAISIPEHSLAGVQIFFPDPWQKRRHHIRRLIQPEFMQTMAGVLQQNGSLHLATDWDDYATQMLKVVTAADQFKNDAGAGQFGERSLYRPIISRFEHRAIQEGRAICEIQLTKL
jgi:tRNA (guanine-N7-)-methyltransferase